MRNANPYFKLLLTVCVWLPAYTGNLFSQSSCLSFPANTPSNQYVVPSVAQSVSCTSNNYSFCNQYPQLPCKLLDCNSQDGYACYQFVRAYMAQYGKGSISPIWIPPVMPYISNAYSSAHIDIDNAYLETCAGLEAFPTIPQAMSYSGHTGVRVMDGNVFSVESKLNNNEPLVKHTFYGYANYYPVPLFYIGKMEMDNTTAPDVVNLSGAKEFSLINRSAGGVVYNWCAETPSLVKIEALDASNSRVRITPLGCGTTRLRASYSTSCDADEQIITLKTTTTNCTCAEGTYISSNGPFVKTPIATFNQLSPGTITATIDDTGTSPTITWQKLSGNETYWYSGGQGNRILTIRLATSQYIALRAQVYYEGTLYCTRDITFMANSWGGLSNPNSGGNVSDSAIMTEDTKNWAVVDSRTISAPRSAVAFNNFHVAPNPVQRTFLLSAEQPLAAKVELANSVGQSLYRLNFDQAAYPASIDVSDLPNGIYFLKISTDDDGVSCLKVVVEH